MGENIKTWLIGFAEAEGSFTVAKRGDLAFVITQGYRNVAVLHYIRDILGYGSVIKQGPRTFRYVVQDKVGLGRIIDLFNGRLVLEKGISGEKGLLRFIAAYNIRYSTEIVGITTKVVPTRSDG